MKVVMIGPCPLTIDSISGGVEASVYGLADTLARAGHTIDVFDYPRIDGDDRVEHLGQICVHRFVNHGHYNQDAVHRCLDIYREVKAMWPDVIHLHGTSEFCYGLFELFEKQGIPMVLTVHGLLREEKKKAFFRNPSIKHLYQFVHQVRIEKKLLDIACTIIVDTDYVASKIRDYYNRGIMPHTLQVCVVPQGISSDFFSHSCNPKSDVILSVGTISPRKGHIYTLQMFNQLRSQGYSVQLHIIGAIADKAYYEKLSYAISQSNYRADITLETNASYSQLIKAYKSAKLFVLHSEEESQGIVFAEAMAMGIPIVATNVGGIPCVVKNRECGYLCGYKDVSAMTEFVKDLLIDEQRWKSCSLRAREVARNYDWDGIAFQILKIYESQMCPTC